LAVAEQSILFAQTAKNSVEAQRSELAGRRQRGEEAVEVEPRWRTWLLEETVPISGQRMLRVGWMRGLESDKIRFGAATINGSIAHTGQLLMIGYISA
jgi:hypothetical protein